MRSLVQTVAWGLAVFLLQLTFLPFIAVGEFVPDIVLVWLITVGIRTGHIQATIVGFSFGLLQDLTTTQFFGLAALSKSITAFASGYLFNENTSQQTLGSYRLIVATAGLSFLHGIVYFGVFYQGFDVPLVATTVQSALGVSLYTSIVSLLPMFAFSRTYRTQWTQ